MFIQITKEEFAKEISKKAWYQTNIIIWTIVILYPVFSIADFIYANDIWIQFVVVRIIISLIIVGLYSLFQRNRYDYRVLLHIAFLMISVTSAVLCAIVNVDNLNIYFLLFSVVILFFNLLVFWEPINSIIQTLISILLVFVWPEIILRRGTIARTGTMSSLKFWQVSKFLKIQRTG